VYIIADSFAKETLQKLRQLPLHVIEVSFENSTKTKALNAAFARIDRQYDVALICDADNVLAGDFLQKINNAFMNGAKAVQGRRVAKNLDTSFAILDACSEGINNNIFRKGANASGLSSSIIGSGMAYDFTLVKQLLSEISAVGGFDKILQLKVVQQGIKIYYLEDALVFDEKVDSAHAFKQQRKRWVSSQFIYLKQFFFPAFKQLFKGNLSYFNLAVINNFILPRAFLFLILPLLAIVSWFISTSWGIASTGLLMMYFLALVIAIPSELVNKNLLQAVLRIPRAILLMAGTLFQGKKANKTFIHTVHTKTEVTNPYLNRLPKR
jgi:cellulose synthase/poly-beta-1,6-N-acetylglucosamine synthase-like glycosyltransferase